MSRRNQNTNVFIVSVVVIFVQAITILEKIILAKFVKAKIQNISQKVTTKSQNYTILWS